MQKINSPKVAKLANLKSHKGFRTIETPEPGAISDSLKGGAKYERVNRCKILEISHE